MFGIVAAVGVLAETANLPGIVGAFLAGLALNEEVHDKPAKEKLESEAYAVATQSANSRSQKEETTTR